MALIGVVGLLVLGYYLSRGKPFLTLATLHTLNLTVSSSLVLQGLGPTSESLATTTALVRPLVLSAGSSATSNGWWRLCRNHTGHTRGCTAGHSDWAGPVAFPLSYPAHHYASQYNLSAPDAALGQTALCLQCSICCQAVGHTTWSTRLLPTVRSRVKCDQCQERFTSREKLAKHRQYHHSK